MSIGRNILRYFLGCIIVLDIAPALFFLARRDSFHFGQPYTFYGYWNSTGPAGGIEISFLALTYDLAIYLLFATFAALLHVRFRPVLILVGKIPKIHLDTGIKKAIFLWIAPLLVGFYGSWFACSQLEEHLEYGKVGCFDTGFPYTYRFGCSTPPIVGLKGITHSTSNFRYDQNSYDKNIGFYFLTAIIAVFILNFLLLSKTRIISLTSRYFLFALFLFIYGKAWLAGYNDGQMDLGLPKTFLNHYFDRFHGDVYSFDGKSLLIDLLIFLFGATLLGTFHSRALPKKNVHSA